MTIFAAISAICGLIIAFIQLRSAQAATNTTNSDVSNIQAERKALSEGNGDQVDALLADQHDRVDRLLKEHGGDSGN